VKSQIEVAEYSQGKVTAPFNFLNKEKSICTLIWKKTENEQISIEFTDEEDEIIVKTLIDPLDDTDIQYIVDICNYKGTTNEDIHKAFSGTIITESKMKLPFKFIKENTEILNEHEELIMIQFFKKMDHLVINIENSKKKKLNLPMNLPRIENFEPIPNQVEQEKRKEQ
jgi:hypothetical protein